MPSKPLSLLAAAIIATLMLSGCGGGHSTKSARTVNAAPVSSPAAGQPEYGASRAAPVPAGLDCGAVAPVWVNTGTHAYHVSSDPLYGRTKRGEYMCPQTASSRGYHEAGGRSMHGRKHSRHRNRGGMMQAQPPSPSPM